MTTDARQDHAKMPTTLEEIRATVQARYGAAAQRVADGATVGASCCGPADGSSGCCGATSESWDPITADLYDAGQTAGLPAEALLASLGCGNPTALAELHEGETVLDLGSGGGIDVLLSAKRVGASGKAYGLDMTDEMLALALENKEKARRHQRRVPERPHRIDSAAVEHGRRDHLELRDQSLRRQTPGVEGGVPCPAPGWPIRRE